MTESTRCRPRIASSLLLIVLLICGGGQVQAFDWKKPLTEGKSSFALPNLSGTNFDIVKKEDNKHYQLIASRAWGSMRGLPQGSDGSVVDGDSSSSSVNSSKVSNDMALIGSLMSWLCASWIALMTPHPNPAVAATLPIRHDILTFSQAVAFQVPVMVAAFTALEQNYYHGVDMILHRRLLLGIGSMSLWTGAGVFYGKTFSRGYELFSTGFRFTIAAIEIAIAAWCFSSWAASVRQFDNKSKLMSRLLRGSVGSIISLLHGGSSNNHNRSLDNPNDTAANDIALYTASTIGLLALAVMPQLVSFPTATIPTILGKRFSRAASGITFLAGVMAYSVRDSYLTKHGGSNSSSSLPIQTLRRGLAIGAMGHLFLVVGKFVGIDGGGLLITGDGLWEFYPSMVNAARAATTLMLATFVTTAFVCTR